MRIEKTLFFGGKPKCLTMSYDDGREFDEKLIEIFNRYNIKGSFHLNSGFFDRNGYVKKEAVKELYEGHEVSAHTLTHPFLCELPDENVLSEILEDRKNLESICGYVVRGMSYPFGNYDDRVIDTLKTAGMEYSRTVATANNFSVPVDFMKWHPTCHHNGGIMEKLDSFLSENRYNPLKLFYVWGHSYEFPNNDNWNLIEEFCEKASGRDDVWYATNIEIADYINALKNLKISAACDRIYNPSAVDVWVKADGQPVRIDSGKTACL